ncbi:hypothetical protein [Halobaculum lipolyticum]|uniref:Major facilitator superfamily (MFS) profile domain-containing protein n=1 Tax=Halobaculum lipolyticum TaxID=3032001 RepID=A0ABD5WDE0_9EURY|nr:hypothetical protein [Halobaculum sp. DT31]
MFDAFDLLYEYLTRDRSRTTFILAFGSVGLSLLGVSTVVARLPAVSLVGLACVGLGLGTASVVFVRA